MKLLLLEYDKFYANLLKKELLKNILFISQIDVIPSFDELKKSSLDYDLFIVDYILEDSEGSHIDFLLEKEKNIITLTKFDKQFLKSTYKDRVIEYVLKEDKFTIKYLINFIKRLNKNKSLNVLVVDDSIVVRKKVTTYLNQLFFKVIEAENGKKALNLLENKSIDLIITDLNMPEMDGSVLVKKVREKYSAEELPIIVLSSQNSDVLLNVLKFGANDFLHKPFLKEEFVIRVHNILDVVDSFKKIKREIQIDPLTEAYNRYFFENYLESLFNSYETKSIAMLDIDFFKKINDTYGHKFGDEVLRDFVKRIKEVIRKSDIVIRYGGEEFLLFMPNTTKKEALIVLLKIKRHLQKSKFNYTFSAGICDEAESLAEMIKIADERLYIAKREGRDKIVIE